MNHDVTHCVDYAPNKCPASCFRAEVTKEFYDRYDELGQFPTSWAYFSRSAQCPLNSEQPEGKGESD